MTPAFDPIAARLYDRRRLQRWIDQWLDEDCGHGDLTTEIMIAPEAEGRFAVTARQPFTLAGLEIAEAVFRRVNPARADEIEWAAEAADGEQVAPGAVLARVAGPARLILTGERVALNLLQHLSGVATLTAAFVEAVSGTGVAVADTRKTTPGLRGLEKYAVRCGGGRNHRLGLDGGIMLKDNHIAVAGGIGPAVAKARAAAPLLTKIEVECDRLDQVDAALEAGADVIMLDNMNNADMTEAVARVGGRALLECSGGVTLQTIRGKAETGVDVISVGRMTQAAAAVDIGLDADAG
ncbi:MAG: carboxylating nicotinate-nucleotide diphosphorylase [Pseudomonadota bacterium]